MQYSVASSMVGGLVTGAIIESMSGDSKSAFHSSLFGIGAGFISSVILTCLAQQAIKTVKTCCRNTSYFNSGRSSESLSFLSDNANSPKLIQSPTVLA